MQQVRHSHIARLSVSAGASSEFVEAMTKLGTVVISV